MGHCGKGGVVASKQAVNIMINVPPAAAMLLLPGVKKIRL